MSRFNRLLPKADNWDTPGETDQNDQIDQSAPANESAESDTGHSQQSRQ